MERWIQKYKKDLWQMHVPHCPELSSSSFLHVSINTNSSSIWATPLQGEATWHVITHLFFFSICAAEASTITHLLACFVIMRTPNSIKTDNGPAYISRHFKQFLLSFSIKHFADIPCNPQTWDIVFFFLIN